jgi:hypothetical protein
MEKRAVTSWPACLLTGIAAAVSLLLGHAHATEVLTLDDYFAAALTRSEVVATQQELIRQAEERYQQASSALLPTVNGIGSYSWRERAGIDSATTPASEPLARINATVVPRLARIRRPAPDARAARCPERRLPERARAALQGRGAELLRHPHAREGPRQSR